MTIFWDVPRNLTDVEQRVIGGSLKAMGIAAGSVEARVFPSLSVGISGKPRWVGRAFLLYLNGVSIALARNAYTRFFPSVESSTAAAQFEVQLRALREYDEIAFSSTRFVPVYLASPRTAQYCAAVFEGKATNVRWVASSKTSPYSEVIETGDSFLHSTRLRIEASEGAANAAAAGFSPTN